MMKNNLAILFVTIVLIFGVLRISHAATLYAVTWDENLISIDTTDASATLIGPVDSQMDAFGLADRNGELWTFDQKFDRMKRLDPMTGTTLETVDVGFLPSFIGEGALTFDNSGNGYLANARSFLGSNEGNLYSIDLDTASSSTILGNFEFLGLDGMDFDSSGTLYGFTHGTAILYTIDPLTGASTMIGDTGFDSFPRLAGLTFMGDTLYGVMSGSLYTIDPLTGAGALIGDIGFGDISGLTALNTIPIPPAILLFGSGLIGLISVARRKKS